MARLTVNLLYDLDATGDEIDSDQVLHWMASIAEAIGDLDDDQRRAFVAEARSAADEAERSGDPERAAGIRRIADAEAG
ncbi:MAG: hypothetical protein AB1627_10755 [Chloroflexota bacterium]